MGGPENDYSAVNASTRSRSAVPSPLIVAVSSRWLLVPRAWPHLQKPPPLWGYPDHGQSGHFVLLQDFADLSVAWMVASFEGWSGKVAFAAHGDIDGR